jgi:hypothetical protein
VRAWRLGYRFSASFLGRAIIWHPLRKAVGELEDLAHGQPVFGGSAHRPPAATWPRRCVISRLRKDWCGRAENYSGALDLTFASSNRDALRSERQICCTNVTRWSPDDDLSPRPSMGRSPRCSASALARRSAKTMTARFCRLRPGSSSARWLPWRSCWWWKRAGCSSRSYEASRRWNVDPLSVVGGRAFYLCTFGHQRYFTGPV